MLQSMGSQRVNTTERLNKNKEATLVSLRCLLGTLPESPRLRFRASMDPGHGFIAWLGNSNLIYCMKWPNK